MSNSNPHTTTVAIANEVKARLDARAVTEERPLGWVATRAIRFYLDNTDETGKPLTPTERQP